MAVAADPVGDGGDLDRQGEVRGAEPREQLVHRLEVLLDEPALGAPFLGAAEEVERGPPKAPHLRDEGEHPPHPGAVGPLAGFSGRRIGPREKGRGHVEGDPKVPLEARREPLLEGPIRVEPGHLVLVLVGHQLVGEAGYCPGERVARPERPLPLAYSLDEATVARRPRRVLPLGEVPDTPLHELVEAPWLRRLETLVALRSEALHRPEVATRPPPPSERLAVHLHRHPVELDGPLDGDPGHRDEAPLVGEAEEEEIARDGVPEEAGRDAGRVEDLDVVAPRRGPDPPDDGLGREREVRVAGELPGDLLVGVDDDLRALRAHDVEGEVPRRDEAVAAEHEVRRPGVEANRPHVLRAGRDPHVARHRPTLLGHPELVDGRERDAFEVRGHGDESADGDHPGTPPPPRRGC